MTETNNSNRKKLYLKKTVIPTMLQPKYKIKLKQPFEPKINQLNQYLDQHFKHNLMYLKDNWSEVKYKYHINTMGKENWWDLEMLLEHFAEQLNISNMGGPAPKWPSNPFNRIFYTSQQLSELGVHLNKLQIPINHVLKELIIYLKKSSADNIEKLSTDNIEKSLAEFIKHLECNYRYQLINKKDSQGNYIGHWVPKKQPLSIFENQYKEFLLIPPREYDEDDDEFIETDEYLFYLDLLNHIPSENCDFSTDDLVLLEC